MQKKSHFLRAILRLLNLILLIGVVVFCIYIMRFNDIFQEGLKKGWYTQFITKLASNSVEEKYAQYGIYTSDTIFKVASIYGIFFMAILSLLVSMQRFVLVFCLENAEYKKHKLLNQISTMFILLGAIFIFYTFMPFFHKFESKTVIADREVKLPDQIIVDTEYVYEEVEITPSFPFNISGKEAVVIGASDGMKDFMTKFYKANIPFFVQEGRRIFILHEGELQLFDGNFDQISYSGNSSNIAEILCNINYDTIWVFSNELSKVEPESISNSIQEKNIIIYSPQEIDVNNLKTYFSVVNGIAVMDIK